jgi:hypothetical protein
MGLIHVSELTPAPPRGDESGLRLHVIYTGPETTRASLKGAGVLARDLGARLELLVARVVPYPLPLDSPPASSGFTDASLDALAAECGVEADVRVLLCRDREETIPRWLPAGCVAVIGRRRRWGPGSFRRLIRAVRRDGHHVIVVDGGR